jgi:hypothetical protein
MLTRFLTFSRAAGLAAVLTSLLGSQPALAASPPLPDNPSLEFIQNKGQWDQRVRYAAALPAGRLFVQADAFTYAFVDPAAFHHPGSHQAPGPPPAAGADRQKITGHAYTVHFVKASPRAALTAARPTSEVRNYFVGSDEKHWASHVGSFRQLHYAGLWPGIDLQLYENADQHLEYDFLLAPRANPSRVALLYDGADAVSLNNDGNLLVKTSVGSITELAPRAWQTGANGQHQPVACRYVLKGSTVSFQLGAYDRQRALTIDPTVIFSSFTGSTADNWGFTATYDLQGNMYSGGIAFAVGYPATTGAFDTSFNSLTDIALIKYNTAVSGPAARVWATYLGGTNTDFPHSLVTNSLGELVMLGSTSSLNYPTTSSALNHNFSGGSTLSPFQADPNRAEYQMPNGSDLVVTRLSAGGDALRASTYLGGSGNDGVQSPVFSRLVANYGDCFRSDVLLDGDGNVYVAANTTSSNFPGLAQGFDPSYAGNGDGVVCKLPPALNTVLWAGLLGGSGSDAVYSIQRDSQGRVFVCGGTTSINFPSIPGAYKPGYGGVVDGFVARISADGRQLERTSFIGTASYDQAQFLQLDAAGNPYLFGQTLGTFPRTPGLFSTPVGSLFVQKLNPDLTNSLYSTVFGGNNGPSMVPTAFLVDDCERVYVSGWGGFENDQQGLYLGGNTFGLPLTTNAVQRTTDGSDFYLAQFRPGMASLEYATYFGSNGIGPNGQGAEHVDGGTSRFDKRGVVYQAVCGGCSSNQGFPVPAGANTYTSTNGSSNCNNAAFKIDFQPQVADPGPRRAVCVDGGPVALGGTPAGGTWSGPGVQALPAGGYQFVPTAVGPGQYIITYTVATTGICQATLRVRYVVAPPVVPTISPLPALCQSAAAVTLAAVPPGGVFSGPGVVGGTRFDPVTAGTGTHTLTYTIADSLGCGITTRQVVVTPLPIVAAGRDTTLCADLIQPFQLQGFAPAGGTWSGPGVTPTGFFTPPNTNNRGGVFTLTYTVVQAPCQSSANRRVTLAPTSAQNVGLNLPQCSAAPEYNGLAPFDCALSPILITPTATFVWDFGDGSPSSTEVTPTHRYQEPGTYYIRLTARYAGCEVITQFAPVSVGPVFVPNIITVNGDSLNNSFKPRFSCQPTALKLFSRWGQLVYETEDYHNNWSAENLAAGIYYYLMRDRDGRSLKGWVEVIKPTN